ncbi:hypothetical protein [Nocardia sienata]|uniref:hypothetical protein n=1 Tax=Nocardia sienata TaxID=248552 RepID=UPI0007A3907C|nr:hypothetical protein [Nocardia sienata]
MHEPAREIYCTLLYPMRGNLLGRVRNVLHSCADPRSTVSADSFADSTTAALGASLPQDHAVSDVERVLGAMAVDRDRTCRPETG